MYEYQGRISNEKFKMRVKREEGFTLVELLVTMTISSMLLGFVFSMYLFSERLLVQWQKKAEVRDAVSGCLQRILRDIQSNHQLVECSDTLLILDQGLGKNIVYHFGGKQVLRNEVQMGAPNIELTSKISATEDTTGAQPVRHWGVSVIARRGDIIDSSVVCLSTIMSSGDMVQESMKEAASNESIQTK